MQSDYNYSSLEEEITCWTSIKEFFKTLFKC